MGYTHYWTPTVLTPKEKKRKFDKFFATCKKLFDNLPQHSESAGGFYKEDYLTIKGGSGTGKPYIGHHMIDKEKINGEWRETNYGRCLFFNGDEKLGLAHETFAIWEDDDNKWAFCKTSRKPYDLLVCACLIAAGKILGYKVSSDGDLADWKPAFDFYASVMEVKRPVRSKSKFLNKDY